MKSQRRWAGILKMAESGFFQSGVDLTVIALWLGHEDPATTHLYLEADLKMKEAALCHLEDPGQAPLRFHAPDRLLSFLEAL